MLRLTVILLLLANAIWFGWSHGLLLGLGLGPTPSSEPQRITQQILPEALRVVSAEEAQAPETGFAPPRSAECLLAGPFDAIAGLALRQVLQAWPPGTWSLEPVLEPAGSQLLRLPAVDDNLRARLDEVRPALAGNPLRPCRQP